MAAITFKIGGKYDDSGVKKAISSISSLTGAAKKFNAAIAGFVASKVISGVKSAVEGSGRAFLEQSAAFSKYNIAVANNAKLSADAISSLEKKIKSIANGKNSMFDDAELKNALALSANMKLTGEQMEDVAKAASDMASAGIMPLDQAVKALTMSYGGNITQLTKMFPEMKGLTREELQQGAAVKMLSDRYDGLSESMAGTFSGREKIFSNATGNLTAAIGGISQSLRFETQGALIEPIRKATDFLETYRDKIVNIFLNIPEVAASAFNTVALMLDRLFSADGLIDFFKTSVRLAEVSLRTMRDILIQMFQSAAEVWQSLMLVTFGNIGVAIKNGAGKAISFVADKINDMSASFAKTAIGKWLGAKGEKIIEFTLESEQYKTFGSFVDDVKSSFNHFGTAADIFTNGAKEYVSDMKTYYSGFSDIAGGFAKDMQRIADKDLPESLRNALASGAAEAAANVSSSGNADTGRSAGFGDLAAEVSAAMESLSEPMKQLGAGLRRLGGIFGVVGSVITSFQKHAQDIANAASTFTNSVQGVAEGSAEIAAAQKALAAGVQAADQALKSSIIGLIISLIVKLASALSETSESMNAVMNGLDLIMEIVADIIGPAVEKVVKPFADSIKPVGEILGVILELVFELLDAFTPLNEFLTFLLSAISSIIKMLAPILRVIITLIKNVIGALLQALGPIMDIINVIVEILQPVLKFVTMVIIGIANAFVAVFNVVSGIIRVLSFGLIDLGEADFLSADVSNYDSNVSGDEGTTTAASAGASYTAAKDVYVTINFSQSYVNGDAQAIAVMLAREIRTAEKMNLV